MKRAANAAAFVVSVAVASTVTCACGKHPAPEQRTGPVASEAPPKAPVLPPSGPATVPPALTEIPSPPAPAPPLPMETDFIPGVPAATSPPPGFADLAKATKLEIRDSWMGVGKTHDLVAVLERPAGARAFSVDAKVTQITGWMRESMRDPTEARRAVDTDDDCMVRNTISGACDVQTSSVPSKKSSVDAASVESFLSEVAQRRIDPKQDHFTGNAIADDYPRAHVIVWVPSAKEPIHLAFRDQRKHWRMNGAFLTLDPGSPPPTLTNLDHPGVHKRINERYQRMLKSMGIDAWITDVNRFLPR